MKNQLPNLPNPGCFQSHEVAAVSLGPGLEVQITAGSLRGVQGTVVAHRNENQLLLAVPSLGQGVFLQIDGRLIERTNLATMDRQHGGFHHAQNGDSTDSQAKRERNNQQSVNPLDGR